MRTVRPVLVVTELGAAGSAAVCLVVALTDDRPLVAVADALGVFVVGWVVIALMGRRGWFRGVWDRQFDDCSLASTAVLEPVLRTVLAAAMATAFFALVAVALLAVFDDHQGVARATAMGSVLMVFNARHLARRERAMGRRLLSPTGPSLRRRPLLAVPPAGVRAAG